MLNNIRIKWNQFIEAAYQNSPLEAVKKAVSALVQLNRVVVPVYHDLTELKPLAKSEDTASLRFVVLDAANVASFAGKNRVRSRDLKGAYNTRCGYYAYAVVSKDEIIGDIWCATPGKVKRRPVHPDLAWLDLQCGEGEAYMFDMFVAPHARGKVVTQYLLGNALKDLKGKGVSRVYGFYEKANLPALWTHRLFGYKEIRSRKVFQVLFYRRSSPCTGT